MELHDLNVSPNTTGIIISTIRDLWAVWQVWGTGELHRVLVRKSAGKGKVENLGVNGGILLKWVFKKYVSVGKLDTSDSG